jgi:ribosomal protein L11 methylase PrmA
VDDVADDVILEATERCPDLLAKSLGWQNRHSQDPYYPLVVNGIAFSVQQVQRGEVEGTYGTGATVWPAAMVLMKYLAQHTSHTNGKRVVDLGSGTAVTSVAAAILGVSHVICTDGKPSVVQLAKDNLQHVAKELGGTTPVSSSSSSSSSSTTTNTTTIIHNCEVVVLKYWWDNGSLKE